MMAGSMKSYTIWESNSLSEIGNTHVSHLLWGSKATGRSTLPVQNSKESRNHFSQFNFGLEGAKIYTSQRNGDVLIWSGF